MTLIEQARIIAADMWSLDGPNRKAVLNGEWDDIRQVRCALLALETQAAEIARLRGLLGEADRTLGEIKRRMSVLINENSEVLTVTVQKHVVAAHEASRTTLAKLRAAKEDG